MLKLGKSAGKNGKIPDKTVFTFPYTLPFEVGRDDFHTAFADRTPGAPGNQGHQGHQDTRDTLCTSYQSKHGRALDSSTRSS